MLLFVPNSCLGPVAGVYGAIVGQGKKLFLDALEQGIVITTGQVRAANAVPKKHIAAYQ